MTELFDSISQALANPQQRHAMIVHMPVAISVLGVVTLIVLAIVRGRSNPVRWLAAGMYFIAAVTAYMAKLSGFEASMMVEVFSPAFQDDLKHHKQLAENLPIAMLTQAILISLTALPKKKVRITMLVLSLVMSLWLAVWVAQTAHHGGEMVYVHGAAVVQDHAP
jgi:uncharacterized membrane protein